MRHSVEAREPLVSLPLTLCACANLIGGDAPTVDEVLDVVWLTEESQPKPATPIYCYGRIGARDCHAALIADGGGV